MSEWVGGIPKRQTQPAVNFDSDGMPIYAQVIAGIFVALMLFLFLFIMYAMLKHRRVVYCDIFKLQKEMKKAVLGAGRGAGRSSGGKGGGVRNGWKGGEGVGAKSIRKEPLLPGIVIQVEREGTNSLLVHGPVTKI